MGHTLFYDNVFIYLFIFFLFIYLLIFYSFTFLFYFILLLFFFFFGGGYYKGGWVVKLILLDGTLLRFSANYSDVAKIMQHFRILFAVYVGNAHYPQFNIRQFQI